MGVEQPTCVPCSSQASRCTRCRASSAPAASCRCSCSFCGQQAEGREEMRGGRASQPSSSRVRAWSATPAPANPMRSQPRLRSAVS